MDYHDAQWCLRMAFCHGNGNLNTDGCCWVGGEICPNRWKIVDGRILKGASLTDLGTVEDFAASVSNNPNIQKRITDQAQSLTFACSVAVDVLVADPSLLDDRPGFEAAWAAHQDYQPIADAWESIGKPRSWCPEYGPGEGQCCYAEDEATNAAKGATLTTSAVAIRSQRST